MAKKKEAEPEIDNADFDVEKAIANKEIGLEDDKDPQPTPEEAIAKLTKDMETEKAARIAAEARADNAEKAKTEATVKVGNAETDVIAARETAITSQLAAKQTELDTLETQYASALELGDTKLAAQLNRKINQASVEEAGLKNAKGQLDAYKAQAVERAKQPVQQQGYSQEAQAWIDRNPRFGSDPSFKAKAIGAHTEAMSLGYAPNSPAYFKLLDERVADPAAATVEDPAPRRQTLSAAPPSRDQASMTGKPSKGGRQLTAKQVEAAEIAGMSVAEYAKALDEIEGSK